MAKIKTRSKSKLGLLIGILILSVALIFGTKLVKQNQENRSKAAACVPKEGVNSLKFDTSCGKDSYRYMTFSCYDGFGRREGDPKSCKSSAIWKSYADKYCKGHFSKCDTKPVNGLCDTEFMKCKKGTPEKMEGPKYVAPLNREITPPATKLYWRCKGINGGKNDSCNKLKEAPVTPTPNGKVDGVCGSADNAIVSSVPTKNLCKSGTLEWYDKVGSDGQYNWTCRGIGNGASDAGCGTHLIKVNGDCTPGEKRCGGSNPQICSTAHFYVDNIGTTKTETTWNDLAQCGERGCDPVNFTCNANYPVNCTPGESKCDGNTLRICYPTGHSWASSTCVAGCNSTTKECNICTAGEKRCSGRFLQRCKTDGSGWETDTDCSRLYMGVCNPNTNTCDVNR